MKFKFEELQVYQKSLDLIDAIYQETRRFPGEESYGLTSQFRRASVSVALNISEGSGGTKKEFKRFLRTALNSVKECVVCTTVALRQNYISENTHLQLRERLVEIAKMISGLQKYLDRE